MSSSCNYTRGEDPTFTRATLIHSLPKSMEKTAALDMPTRQQAVIRPTTSKDSNRVFISNDLALDSALDCAFSSESTIKLMVSHVCCCGCVRIRLERVASGKTPYLVYLGLGLQCC